MKTAIVIPVRYGSTRFPGKPLAEICGQSMLSRVWRIAKQVPAVDRILIATDDQRIEEHALRLGAEVIMTSSDCENGSERVYQALQNAAYVPDLVINFQGDAVLTPPKFIQALISGMQIEPEIGMGTLACEVTREQAQGATLVVFDVRQRALYFSRSLIPHHREAQESFAVHYHKHIGIYAYRYKTLEQYIRLKASALEKIEKLEQLRALENAIAIKVVLVDRAGRTLASVDKPEDVTKVEAIIKREGELV